MGCSGEKLPIHGNSTATINKCLPKQNRENKTTFWWRVKRLQWQGSDRDQNSVNSCFVISFFNKTKWLPIHQKPLVAGSRRVSAERGPREVEAQGKPGAPPRLPQKTFFNTHETSGHLFLATQIGSCGRTLEWFSAPHSSFQNVSPPVCGELQELTSESLDPLLKFIHSALLHPTKV